MRLFQVELEHYEKIEGTMLSLDGKANRLATMIRNNLGAAMQGLAVIPLFAGYDLDAARSGARPGGSSASTSPAGVYEETGYDGIGSGSLFAKSALKKRYRAGLSRDEAVRLAVEALYDAADDDTATGGPDLIRRIFPVVMTATAEGTRADRRRVGSGGRGGRRRPYAEPGRLSPASCRPAGHTTGLAYLWPGGPA